MRTLRIYTLKNFPIYHTAVLQSNLVHYIPSTHLSYNWKFALLITFLSFSRHPHPLINFFLNKNVWCLLTLYFRYVAVHWQRNCHVATFQSLYFPEKLMKDSLKSFLRDRHFYNVQFKYSLGWKLRLRHYNIPFCSAIL